MMKAMEKRQEARKNQEKTLKRMMAYQKKAEQMVSRKRMNHHMIRKGSFPNKRILETIHETPACVKGITIEYYIF